ncbi:SOS response associated peptidase (SRAP) [Paucimonas lemoignei]|uniref:SOS response associated peptidase (SRAP) n=2 Tax=Paucimonas lemoignei TaxID=29443 RepID=A0A4R3HP78_PAULE|nr:SOS response associated peptidase (SRAP) [Paucimonas lemoignei]
MHRLLDGTEQFDTIHWGYRPVLAVERDLPERTTAPLENILVKPYYKGLMDTGRAILSVDAWYELEDTGRDAKRWRFQHQSGELALVAVVARWEVYGHQPPGAGFAIVMYGGRPAILAPEDARQWLDLSLSANRVACLVRDKILPGSQFVRTEN